MYVFFSIPQELLVYVAREGLNTRDIFRRPGNPTDTRRVVKRLSEGKPVIFSNYSFYTLASVVKVRYQLYVHSLVPVGFRVR